MLNRLSSLTYNGQTPNYTFGYDPLSRRNSLTRPNGINTTYGYDSMSDLLSVLHKLGTTTLDGATYTYDQAGNPKTRTDKRTNVTLTYGYDNIYQLLSAKQGTTTKESYTYDLVGNRLSSLGVSPYNYNSSNELTSTPSGSYTYDNNGNEKSRPDGTTFNWDSQNRLTQVVLPGTGGTVTFKYDPFGRRAQKSFTQGSTTTTTNYLYDGPNLLEELDNSGGVLARYTHGPGIDSPVAMLRSGTNSYYEQDGIGSVTSLSTSAGALANTYSYDSFGKVTASGGTLTNSFRYTGREYDGETGIYEYRQRYYDQNVGRFLSEDRDRQELHKSLYAYVRNNPTIFVDPSGLVARLYCEIIPTGRGRTKWQKIGLALSHPAHCFLYVSCHGSGHYLELYGPPEGGAYGIPHDDQPLNLDRTNNSTEHTLTPPPGMGCCEFENRLIQAYSDQASHLPEYDYSGPNSNTFVNNVIQEAGGTADFPPNAYGWNFGQPGSSPGDSADIPID